MGKVGGCALDGNELLPDGLVEARDGGEEAEGVGVAGGPVDVVSGGTFDDSAGVHNVDGIGVAGYDAEVVRDDNDGGAAFLGESADELEELGLDGDVDGGGGFVGEEDLGLATEGHGDHDALPHATAHVVRIVVEPTSGVGYADFFEELTGAGVGGSSGEAEVHFEGLGELTANGEDGVERRHGLLEDNGNVLAASASHLVVAELEQVRAVEKDLAFYDLAWGEGMRRIRESALTVLPHPLSPTRPIVSPARRE